MYQRPATIVSALLAAIFLSAYLVNAPMADRADPSAADDGIVKVRSAFDLPETVNRLQRDVAEKGIMMFLVVDQAKLAADAGIKLRPSTLLVFGNPPLGIQFITSRPEAGLDWPVRLLVHEDEGGQVWASYTDFAWIARRHHINDRELAFTKASSVIASITSSIAGR